MEAESEEKPVNVDRVASTLDAESRDLLQVAADGDAYTGRIRRETGLSRQAIKRRARQLEKRGIVASEIETPESGGQPQRHVYLTDFGRRLVDGGLLEKINDTNSNVQGLNQRLDELEADVQDALDEIPDRGEVRSVASEAAEREVERVVPGGGDQVSRLEDRIEDLENRVDKALSGRRSRYQALEEEIESLREELTEEIEDVRNLARVVKSDLRELKE